MNVYVLHKKIYLGTMITLQLRKHQSFFYIQSTFEFLSAHTVKLAAAACGMLRFTVRDIWQCFEVDRLYELAVILHSRQVARGKIKILV